MILLLILIGSLNWGTTALGYNFVEIIKNLLNNSLKMETYIDKIIYFLVALAGITLAMNRDLWSPCIENFSALRPTAPVLNLPSPGNGLVNLSWSASANATSYKIKVHDILANTYLFRDTNNLSHTFTGLTNGRSYNFSVVGKNSRGESPSSNTRGPIIPIMPSAALILSAGPIVPSVPLNVKANISENTATITWDKPTTFTGITGYRINVTKTTTSGTVSNQTIDVSGANTLTGRILITRNNWDTFEISVAAVYPGIYWTIGPASVPMKLPILFPETGTHNDGEFLIYSQFFTPNEPARLLVDTDRPRNANGVNMNGLFTLAVDYGYGQQMINDSNSLPNPNLAGDNALGGWPMPWNNSEMGIMQGKANGLKIAGSVQNDRNVLIKLIDKKGNTISQNVSVVAPYQSEGVGQ